MRYFAPRCWWWYDPYIIHFFPRIAFDSIYFRLNKNALITESESHEGHCDVSIDCKSLQALPSVKDKLVCVKENDIFWYSAKGKFSDGRFFFQEDLSYIYSVMWSS